MSEEAAGRERAAFFIFFGSLGLLGLLKLCAVAFGWMWGLLVFVLIVAVGLWSLYRTSDKSQACGPDM